MAQYPYGMSDLDIARYRKKAEQCRRQAEQSSLNPIDKQSWLRLAEDWTAMAHEAERRRDQAMEHPDRAKIIIRASELWEEAGMPEGRAEEFYKQAQQELRNEEQSDPKRTRE